MEDEVSGSDSDVSLSVTYLRAVLLAEMSERLHRLVYRRTLKNITKQSETNKSARRRNKKFIKVRAEYLYLKAILYNFRSYENLNLCHFSFYIVRGWYYQSANYIMQRVMFNGLIYSGFNSSLTSAVRSISGDAGSVGQKREPGTTLEKIQLSKNICLLNKLFSRLSRVMLIRRGQRGGYRLLPI